MRFKPIRRLNGDYEKIMRSEGVGNGRADQGYEEVVVDAIPYENNLKVYLCRNLKQPVEELWPQLKSYN